MNIKEGLLRNKTFSRMSNKKMRLDDKMSFRQPDLHSYRPGLPPSVTHGAEAESDKLKSRGKDRENLSILDNMRQGYGRS